MDDMKTYRLLFYYLLISVVALLCVIMCDFRPSVRSSDATDVSYDTVRHVDTVYYSHPVPRDSVVVRYVTVSLPLSSSRMSDTSVVNVASSNDIEPIDSAVVAIPITQKRYDGDDYRAYVSGYEPNLDSIFVFRRSDVVTITERKEPRRLTIGVSAGYGYGLSSNKFEPYIGIGVSYRLF